MPGVKRKMEAGGGGPSTAGLHLPFEDFAMAEHTGAHAIAEDIMDFQMDFTNSGRDRSDLMDNAGLIRELVYQNPTEQLSQQSMAVATGQLQDSYLSSLGHLYVVEYGTEALVESCFVFMKIMTNWLCRAPDFHRNTSAIFNRSSTMKMVVLEGVDSLGKTLIIRSLAPLANFYGQVETMHQNPMDYRILLAEEPSITYLHGLEAAAQEDVPLFISTRSPATWKNGPLGNACYFVNARNGWDLEKFNGNLHPGIWYIMHLVCKSYIGRYEWRKFTQLMIAVAMDVANRHSTWADDSTINNGCENKYSEVFLAYTKKYNCDTRSLSIFHLAN